MSIVPPDQTQGDNLLSGAANFLTHDDAADNKSSGVYVHRAEEFSATEAEMWCDFYRSVVTAWATTNRWRGVAALAPVTPRAGDVYKNSVDLVLYQHDGSSWLALNRDHWRGLLAVAPVTALAGDVYKNSNDGLLYEYDGSSWYALNRDHWRGVLAGPPAAIAGDMYLDSGDTKVYVFDGANWVALT